MTNYVALDLDRTLFKTDEFAHDIYNVGARIVGTTNEQFKDDAQQFRHISKEGLSHYDFFAQLKSYGVINNQKTVDKIIEMLKTSGKSYIYGDVKEFIVKLTHKNYKPFVLTYGETSYQSLKVGLCKELKGLPVVVVLRPKRSYLTELGEKGILFDDTPQYLLPSGWSSELIDRQKYPDTALLRLVGHLL